MHSILNQFFEISLVADDGFKHCISYHPGTENYDKAPGGIPEKILAGGDETGPGAGQKNHQSTYQIKKHGNRRHNGKKKEI